LLTTSAVLQALDVRAEPLELVALLNPRGASGHARRALADPDAAASRTFNYLTLHLPSDHSAPRTLTVSHRGAKVACAGFEDEFAITWLAAYADCDCVLACAAPGHALYPVYALHLPRVRAAPGC
jgi:hypothetical protein